MLQDGQVWRLQSYSASYLRDEKESSFNSLRNRIRGVELIEWLSEYCREKRWIFSIINRKKEPQEAARKEGYSIPWKIREAIRAERGKIPKVFCERGVVGKEGLRGIKKHAISVGGSREENMVYLTGLSSEPNLKQ